jgi:PHD/YefM family antitoxin component YafN of YafNO toxin-antitoxin module
MEKSIVSTREAVFITQRGRAAGVMVSMEVYENAQHEMDILHLLAQGEKEIAAGIGHELEDVLKEDNRYLIDCYRH